MPVQGFYLDEETYKLLQEEAEKQSRKPGEVLSEIMRAELSKREASERRPESCPKCAEAKIEHSKGLEWHFTADERAMLYCLCLTCGWRYDSREVYRTSILS